MRRALIGFTGPARSGKDTAAAFVLAEFGGYKYSFADPLRAMLKAGLNIDMSEPYWIERKETPIPAFGNKSPRQMLQWLGTEWGRQLIDEDLWLTLASGYLLQMGAGMVVADVRFENEAAWIRRNGGLLVHMQRAAAAPVHAHASEAGVEFDVLRDAMIVNDGTLESLQASVRGVVQT